ncbi:MAG: MATE family efflux transporter [Myxococcota bacterium]
MEPTPPAGSTGEEARRLLGLAWPVVLGQIGLVAMGVVDLLAVRSLGETATAAVGIAGTLSFATLVLAMGAASGLDPLVAQAFGAGKPGRAGADAARGMALVLLLSVPITLAHLYAEPLLVWLRQPPSAVPEAARFCRILAVAVVPFGGFSVLRTLLQGSGAMRPAMWVIFAANLANLIGAFSLVQGVGPIPAFGVVGVAWSTVVVRWAMWLALIAISWPQIRAAWPTEPVWTAAELGRVARHALPGGVQLGLEVWAFNLSSFVAGGLGATAAAAHTSALSAASMSFMLPLGISAAVATRVGNLVGAGLPWRRSAAIALAMGCAVMCGSAAVFLLAPAAIGTLYNPDPAVVALVAAILPIAGAFQWFDGTQVVGFGILRGLGDTRWPLAFNIVAHWMIGLPLGVGLAFGLGLGLPGVWYGLTAGLGVVATLLVARIALRAARADPGPGYEARSEAR